MAGLRDNPFIVRLDLTMRYIELINQLSQSPQSDPKTIELINKMDKYYNEAMTQIDEKLP